MRNPTNMEDFIKAVKEDLEDRLSVQYQGLHAEPAFIEKAQGESYQGIRLHLPERNVAPVLNLESFYEQVTTSTPYQEVIEDMTYFAMKALDESPEISTEPFSNYEAMKTDLVMQAVPIEGNEEMLAKTPHREMADIAIIYRFMIAENERGVMSTVITNDMMQNYGITQEELYADAAIAMKEHRPYEIRPLFDVLGAMSPEFAENEQPDNMLFVATNARAQFGAGVIAHPDFMEEAAGVMRGSFFILPSSIHEVLLLPDDGNVNFRELMAMVKNINEAMVSPEERLTDNVYHYDAQEHLFETAKDHADRMMEKEGRFSIMKDLKELKKEVMDGPKAERAAPTLGGAVL